MTVFVSLEISSCSGEVLRKLSIFNWGGGEAQFLVNWNGIQARNNSLIFTLIYTYYIYNSYASPAASNIPQGEKKTLGRGNCPDWYLGDTQFESR
jgi:hypothetical protein